MDCSWMWGAADGEWAPSSDDLSSDEEDVSIDNHSLRGGPGEALPMGDLAGRLSSLGDRAGVLDASLVTSDVRARFAAYLVPHYERVFRRERWYRVGDVLCDPTAVCGDMGLVATGFMGSHHGRDPAGGSRFYTMRMATAAEAAVAEAEGRRVVKLAVKPLYGRGLTTAAVARHGPGYQYALHRGVPADQVAQKPVECRAISDGMYRVGDMRKGQLCRVVSGTRGKVLHGYVCVVHVDTFAFKDYPCRPVNARNRPGKRKRAKSFRACVDVQGRGLRMACV